jgi:serine/threonine-protein kinase
VNRVGPYVLLRRIGVGGMAEIFLARREGPKGFAKVCALKRILPHLADQPDFVAMFLDEARLAARLSHPHIVQIYDFGQHDGAYFIAMEYVPGEDLLSILRRARDVNMPMPPVLGAAILAAACDALHHAHELMDENRKPLGIVHRDVTPSNLLVSYDGIVKLADFGIAKAERRDAHTAAGALKGKYAYMSPEHALGDHVDRRSDVFSLGVVGHELMTGRRLFHRESELKVLQAITAEPIPRPSDRRMDLPREIDAIILRALERDVTKRYPSAKAFGLALEEFLLANGEAGARLQIARYLRSIFGEDAAAERRRWSVGDLDQGEQTDASAPGAAAIVAAASMGNPTQVAFPPEEQASVSLGDVASEISGPVVDLGVRPGGGARGIFIATSVIALGAAGAIVAFHGKKNDGALPIDTATNSAVTVVIDAAPPPSQVERPPGAKAEVARVARPEGFLTVHVTPAVSVAIDGDPPIGETPIERAKITAGHHTMTLTEKDGGTVQMPIDVEAGAERVVERTLGEGKLAIDGAGLVVHQGARILKSGDALTEGVYFLNVEKGSRRKLVVVEIGAGKVTHLKAPW